MELIEFCEMLYHRKLNQSEKRLLKAVENDSGCFVNYPKNMGYTPIKRIDAILRVVTSGD